MQESVNRAPAQESEDPALPLANYITLDQCITSEDCSYLAN